jgi:hypothetical protein
MSRKCWTNALIRRESLRYDGYSLFEVQAWDVYDE